MTDKPMPWTFGVEVVKPTKLVRKKYYVVQKDGHRYEFNNIKNVRTEYTQQGMVEIIVISGQFLPRQRYKDTRILTQSIKDSNIKDVKDRLMTWLS